MFIETPVFPGCPNFGATSSPTYSVTITETVSGRERRNRNWLRPKIKMDWTVGPREEDTIQELLEWWHAMGSSECGFRVLDYSDYKSCRVNEDPSHIDQPLQLIASGTFQLIKEYTKGPRIQVRPILKPINGTILMAYNGATKNEGTDWTLDYSTGIVTTHFTVSIPDELSWGGEFHVPMRFDGDFPVQIADKEVQSVQFSLIELRNPSSDGEDTGG